MCFFFIPVASPRIFHYSTWPRVFSSILSLLSTCFVPRNRLRNTIAPRQETREKWRADGHDSLEMYKYNTRVRVCVLQFTSFTSVIFHRISCRLPVTPSLFTNEPKLADVEKQTSDCINVFLAASLIDVEEWKPKSLRKFNLNYVLTELITLITFYFNSPEGAL